MNNKFLNYFKISDRKKFFSAVLPILTIIYLEAAVHILTQHSLSWRILIPIAFAVPCGLIVRFLSSCFKPKANKIIYYILISVLSAFFITQCVYYYIFQSYLSVFQFTMTNQVVKNFSDQIFYGILSALGSIAILIVPVAVTIFLNIKGFLTFERPTLKKKLLTLPLIVVLHLLCLVCLTFEGTADSYSLYNLYYGSDTSTDISVANLGVITTTRIELTHILFPGLYSDNSLVIIGINDQNHTEETTTETVETTTDEQDEEEPAETDEPEPEPEPIEYTSEGYNMLDIDFEDMINYETNEDIITLHKYASTKAPTNKNDYTGYFEGYNLITICAESFSPQLISEKLTPTLYKMTHNGFVFENYYGSFESNTTNGEYSLCMGMFPDLSRDKVDNSFKATINNYLPFCLGNIFDRTYNIEAYAFHDYYGTYYQRNLTHPNMGYEFLAPDSGLDIDVYWPSSDLEMMEESVDEWLTTDEVFHAYYMTFSGHYQYNWNNPMSLRNRNTVFGNGYNSETVQAYVSCNLELEKALTYLLQRLEEAGVADKTVIVLTNDHYPYGLSETEYNELATATAKLNGTIDSMEHITIDTQFEKFRNSFICYCPSMAEPVVVDSPCCTIDILPTLLNLFGFDYDSRLICGVDALSDAEHIAILSNQSFITKDFKFNSSNNTITFINTDAEITDEQIQDYKNYVKNIFTVSTAILDNNYYAKFDYLFGDDVDQNSDYSPTEETQKAAEENNLE